jgi:hypothetical protein
MGLPSYKIKIVLLGAQSYLDFGSKAFVEGVV